jgi:acyl-CoA thioester hydrolase
LDWIVIFYYLLTFPPGMMTENQAMPRIKLKPLNAYPFHMDITVRTTDLNYGGHLGNDSLLSLIHEARVGFLASHSMTEEDCGGTALILADTAIVYQGEAFAGDVLRFEVAAGEPSRRGFRLFFRVMSPEDHKAVALVENGMVCFDYETRKTRPLPEALRAICLP